MFKRIVCVFIVITLVIICDPISSQAASFVKSGEKALAVLGRKLDEQFERIYVYTDHGDTENHFTQKAKLAGYDGELVKDMDENYGSDPATGSSCIRCHVITESPNSFGGWLFLNGYMTDTGEGPFLNNGTSTGQSVDLKGAKDLSFMAKGEKGGETVEFYTCGFGYDGATGRRTTEYADSAKKQSTTVTLTKEWKTYHIDLKAENLCKVTLGFGFTLYGNLSGDSDNIFYIDDIRFNGAFSGKSINPMLRSYITDDIYLHNAAYSYDNAVTAMAFISAGYRDRAKEILDSFVYASENDRYSPGRIRNAYAAGDITSFPGWDGTARLPGWYDGTDMKWYEDRYQVGTNVGNTSYAALALLQYDAVYGSKKYVKIARKLMDFVIENCRDDSPGFTAGYDGWPEEGKEIKHTYKSIEHNIDAYAVFNRLYEITGKKKYKKAAKSALKFIKSMYDTDKKAFCTGTGNDGVTADKNNIVLDAQVWCCLALGDKFVPYRDALAAVEEMKTGEGAYRFGKTSENDGFWSEGTAFTALMYRTLGEGKKADAALKALKSIQLKNGLLPASSTANHSTGIGLFDGSDSVYYDIPHIAPTAWYIMALNDFNPYDFSYREERR
ncbi:MAG: hypothetical protein K6F44_02395 [Lachnospiraceae bacterium]|nr:hypothetical protein [Lachnospiraceae bacterium]